jgi:hypothetical protein
VRSLSLSKCFVALVLLSHASGIAWAQPKLETLCEPSKPIISEETGMPVGPILLQRNELTREVERLEVVSVASKESIGGGIRAKQVPVTEEQYLGLCERGYAVGVLPAPTPIEKSARGRKAAIYSNSQLPTSFSIAIYYGLVFGNFWVPGYMPWYYEAHLVDFTVQPVNFHNATLGTHFVSTQMTTSNSNFASDFDAKGFIFGRDTTFCGSYYYPIFGSVAETWVNLPNGYSNVVVWDGTPAPDTCAGMSANTSYRFFAGANRQQQSVYWRYTPGASTPHYQSPVVSSYDPNFRLGGSGVGFLVVAPEGTQDYWALYFSNVSSWVQ